MPIYSRIVVGSDGSEPARDALAVAGLIAGQLKVAVTAVTAWKTQIEVPGARELAWAQRMTTAADVDLTFAGARDVEKVEVKGDPVDALIDTAADRPNSLVVVGAQGLDSQASRVFGSTSNQLSHKSTADVLFVRRRVQEFGAVALATDGSDTSLKAVEQGYVLASSLGVPISLVTVADSESAGSKLLDEMMQKLLASYPEAEVGRRALTGSPAETLSSVSREYDLLVLGNRGMSGFARVLGSTANKVTHHSETNLLLVNTTRN